MAEMCFQKRELKLAVISHNCIARRKILDTLHIFQKAQVTSTKMEPKKRHNFLAQFFMAFLVVWCILF